MVCCAESLLLDRSKAKRNANGRMRYAPIVARAQLTTVGVVIARDAVKKFGNGAMRREEDTSTYHCEVVDRVCFKDV
jgi:hypothetical protein